jgi:hypothetical protein
VTRVDLVLVHGAFHVEASAAAELFYSDADPAFASAWAARLRPTRFVAGEVVSAGRLAKQAI